MKKSIGQTITRQVGMGGKRGKTESILIKDFMRPWGLRREKDRTFMCRRRIHNWKKKKKKRRTHKITTKYPKSEMGRNKRGSEELVNRNNI